MRALPYALALDIEGNKRSLDLLDQAMERDPDHTLAIALAAWCHAQGVVYQFSDNPGQARAKALSLAARALSLGGDPTALPIARSGPLIRLPAKRLRATAVRPGRGCGVG
jgi:adenylate cyclase